MPIVSPTNVLGDLPIYPTSNDTHIESDACDPLPDTTADLSNFAVIIHRGICLFTQKMDTKDGQQGWEGVPYLQHSIEYLSQTMHLLQAPESLDHV
ncbi:hypothetical protein PC9H_009139 [Pleurotus ostreatus]|uniref:Uncharacterized protein n=1 Tax=Pleurotus ostreatus TaxID=5322 RepID=A0A8H6ZQ54_PLEOS|nr:uncharacterized protein PC9H_009139 [Pleurotus ostreatus]KAF7426770.1 hypothetical protein PC9H_009139 [Pleurotus ostreatus]